MTSEHPTPEALEAYQVGETVDAAIAAHVASCDACSAWLDGQSGRRRALLAREAPDAFARRIRATADAAPEVRTRRPTRWLWALPGFAAAALLVLVAVPSTAPTPETPGTTRLKGDLGVDLIVAGPDDAQRRATEAVVLVHPGDRLRVELHVPESREVTAGVLTVDGDWIPLVEAARLDAGVHVPETTLEVDDEPLDAWLIAGSPAEVAAARRAGAPTPEVAAQHLISRGAP